MTNKVTYTIKHHRSFGDSKHKLRICCLCSTKHIAENLIAVLMETEAYVKSPIFPYTKLGKFKIHLRFCNESCMNTYILRQE